YVVNFHPANGARTTDKTTVANVWKERSKPLVHGLVPVSQRIQYVADSGNVEVFLSKTEDFCI
ncbi:MAG: hypothetical protein JW779_11470, partial [Candidatus Thorarchaeota archaeon]|nr:hypothetical protein [Candidatus Thorarchaeota archaeon]